MSMTLPFDASVDGTTTRAAALDWDWWRQAAVYQVYPRSFADSNGDGIGDLRGVIDKLDYLERLGIDAIWLSPFYPSPLADGGYDVSDYRDVDPRLGTIDDMRELIGGAHSRGLRVIVDIVPNHTSERHPWFMAALDSPPGSPERDRYIFRSGLTADGGEPPSDWASHFGGSAWTRLPDGEWYLHLFAREQPDLNWQNPEVRADFLHTLRFWGDLGVDGFRVDVAHGLAKDLAEPLRSQPNRDRLLPFDGSDPLYDREELDEIYAEWRAVFDTYVPPLMAVAESWAPSPRRARYARPTSLGQAFNFELSTVEWSASAFARVIRDGLDDAAISGATTTWVLSNHDIVRHATRFGLPNGIDLDAWLMTGGESPPLDAGVGLARARAATLLMLALPGSAYLYQGEELGLPEVPDLPVTALQDPIWERTQHTIKGRDGCRVPLPWTVDPDGFGFSGSDPWLPQPDAFAGYAADTQSGRPGSTLELYRAALRLRRELQSAELLDWRGSVPEVVDFERPGGWRSLTNFGESAIRLPEGEVLLMSMTSETEGVLEPNTTVWMRRR